MSERKKRPTIVDVAHTAGVSTTTVSNYLNQNFRNMSPDTRTRIEAAIAELGYVPSIGARGLPRKSETKMICIVIPHDIDYTFHHPYFAEVMRGISGVLVGNGFRTILYASTEKSSSDLNYLKSLSNGLVDGFIFFDIDTNDPYLHEFFGLEIPLMVIGKNPEADRNYVDADIERGAFLGTEFLLHRGNTRVALVNGPHFMVFSAQTMEGFRKACASAGGSAAADELIVSGPFSIDFGYESAMQLLSLPDPPTAFYSASGQTTVGILKALEERSLAFGTDVDLVTFGENRTVLSLVKNIPYIRQPETQVGQLAGYRLMEMITSGSVLSQPIVLPVEFISNEEP